MVTFGIIMPVYFGDCLEDVESTLSHVAKCTFDEVLVVRDGPVSEKIEMFLRQMENISSVRIIRLENNVGLGAALKVAVTSMTANFFFRIDAGDYLIVDEIEKTKELAVKGDFDLIGGQMGEFFTNPNEIERVRYVPISLNRIGSFAKRRNPFNHITICAKRSAVLKAGNYRADTRSFEDYSLWISMLQKKMNLHNRSTVLAVTKLGDNFVGRRTGWLYAKQELNFLHKNIQFFHVHAVVFVLLRLVARIVPSSASFFYFFVRKKHSG